MSKNIKTVPTQDFEDVVEIVSKYVEGLRVGSIDGLTGAFHKDAGITASPMKICSVAQLSTYITL